MPTTETRLAYCGRYRLDPEGHPGHRPQPSDPSLAFFTYLGEGGENEKLCADCHFVEAVHADTNPHTGRPGVTDHAFRPRPALPWDEYYCGCRGWD